MYEREIIPIEKSDLVKMSIWIPEGTKKELDQLADEMSKIMKTYIGTTAIVRCFLRGRLQYQSRSIKDRLKGELLEDIKEIRSQQSQRRINQGQERVELSREQNQTIQEALKILEEATGEKVKISSVRQAQLTLEKGGRE